MDRKWALAIGAIVLVIVLALVAAQCAGDDDDDEAGTTTSVADTTTSTEASTTTSTEATTTTAETTTSTTAAAEPELALTADGIEVSGGGAGVSFGDPRVDAIAAMTAALGAPSEEDLQEDCPAGPADFAAWAPVGLSLTFQEGDVVGWSARPTSSLQTSEGIGIGSSVADLRAAYPGTTFTATSLGAEFDADGIMGVATDDTDAGEVTDMWAGTTCIFR
jgi:hypothetical protein